MTRCERIAPIATRAARCSSRISPRSSAPLSRAAMPPGSRASQPWSPLVVRSGSALRRATRSSHCRRRCGGSAPPVADDRFLAVLPLANQSDDPGLSKLSDGLTEILINNLSQIPRLRVMARSTVFRYKEQHADPMAIGRRLDVHAVLTGEVVQRPGGFVVAAELVDVADGSRLWENGPDPSRRRRLRAAGGDLRRTDQRAAAAPEP